MGWFFLFFFLPLSRNAGSAFYWPGWLGGNLHKYCIFSYIGRILKKTFCKKLLSNSTEVINFVRPTSIKIGWMFECLDVSVYVKRGFWKYLKKIILILFQNLNICDQPFCRSENPLYCILIWRRGAFSSLINHMWNTFKHNEKYEKVPLVSSIFSMNRWYCDDKWKIDLSTKSTFAWERLIRVFPLAKSICKISAKNFWGNVIVTCVYSYSMCVYVCVWLVACVLWHIKPRRLFNAKSCLYIYKYIKYIWFVNK